MNDRDVLDLLRQALDEIQKGGKKTAEFSPSLLLSGPDSALDSLDTMLFLDSVEELVRKKAGWDVPVIDDALYAQERNHFATVQSLADHIAGLLAADPHQT
ncbi:MAG: hypothetical protein LBR31_01285 [Desulfovibrio sp.]|jgi:hypothetical protein|nr:hypothetical protein [Desulfovibrio sp.]